MTRVLGRLGAIARKVARKQHLFPCISCLATNPLVGSRAVLAVLLVWAACCGYTAALAGAKDMNVPLWALGGFLFGPIALIAAAGMPDRRQRMFTRFMAEAQGWTETTNASPANAPVAAEDIEAQRRRILGR